MGLYKEYIYVLTHIPTGKKYVGRTKNPKKRYAHHINALINGYHNNKAMQADYDRFGGDYKFEVICEETGSRSDAINSTEKQTMIKLKTYDERYGYNNMDNSMAFVRLEHGLPAFVMKGRKRGEKKVWVTP